MNSKQSKKLTTLAWLLFAVFTTVVPAAHAANNSSYIEVLYDSIAVKKPRGKASWGYSSVISVNGKKFLVDFGKDDKILEYNIRAAGYKWSDFSSAILTVNEEGHRAGIVALNDAPNLVLYATPDCRPVLSRLIKHKIVYIKSDTTRITPELFLFKTYYKSDTVFHESVQEISVIMKTRDGLILYVGCAIPGIRTIYKRAKELFPGEPIYLVAGGFHLLKWAGENDVRKLANTFLKDGVKKVAGGHCTGDLAYDVFKEVFGKNYLFCGIDAHIPLGTALEVTKPNSGFFKKLLSIF